MKNAGSRNGHTWIWTTALLLPSWVASMSIIFIICKMGIKHETCVLSSLRGMRELYLCDVPWTSTEQVTVNVVSIMTLIITSNRFIINIVVFTHVREQVTDRGREQGAWTLYNRMDDTASFLDYHVQNLLFRLRETPTNILRSSSIPGSLSGSVHTWSDLIFTWLWELDLNIPIL